MEVFKHIELESHPDHILSDVEYSYKIKIGQKIPKFDRKEYSTAWLKYLLDRDKVESISRICGRCRRTLLDGEDVCEVCKSRNLARYIDKYDVVITNGEQILTITLNPGDVNAWYIGRRLSRKIKYDYIPLMIHEDILMTTYGCREEFPDPYQEMNNLRWIYIDRHTNTLYILDYREYYDNDTPVCYAMESVSGNLSLDYIEVTEYNIDKVIDRASRNRSIAEDAWNRR